LRDISEALQANAEALIIKHEERIRALLEELQAAQTEFATDLSALAAATEAQIRSRVRAVHANQRAMVDHFVGFPQYDGEPLRIGKHDLDEPGVG
jgi:hypothetical protein